MSRTALDLSPEEWKLYDPRAAIQRRGAQERQELARLRRRALRLARRAARLLREEFGAQKVVLFGSLAQPGRFTRWSDIDLAVWGVSASRFYVAVATVIDLSADFKIDLVDPQDCRPGLITAIEQEGKPL